MASKTRKRGREKENSCKINDENTTITNGKAGNWTITQDVTSDPPLLEDMGLSILLEDSSHADVNGPSPTPPNSEAAIPAHCPRTTQILCEKDQNVFNESALTDVSINEEVFCVYKRRRIDTTQGEDKINCLLDEAVLMIFKWLPKYMLARCGQVCRRWKRLAFDESLWRRLDLGGKSLKPGVVGRVILRGTNSLRLAKTEISSPVFAPQLHHLPHNQRINIRSRLAYLDLSLAAIAAEALEEIFELCTELRKVSLEHCTLNANICKYLSKNPYLDTLNLTLCYRLTGASLIPILSSCHRLQSLNIGWTHLTTNDLDLISKKLPPSLLRLNISGCRHSLEDRHILQIAIQCPDLLELDVSDGTVLTAESVKTIMKHLCNVEYLAFARCYCIQPDAYLELKYMRKLLYLDIYGVLNENALLSLQESLHKIEINKYLFSSVARPTVGIRRTSIWGRRVRD